ncbi:hypothetical protein Taro_006851 [Colocasia esculenta]|uniref:BHLH domain-containing protein n=1 Tax=Colocasia esculenta TaxID=4460 RepID=A0A843U213_COLES|nr:hypothetical protein [Colocasia esculenta]
MDVPFGAAGRLRWFERSSDHSNKGSGACAWWTGGANLQVPEDQDVVNFVMSRFTIPDEASTFAAADFQPFRGGLNCGIITPPSEISHSWVVAPPSIPSCDHPGFPWDIHADQNPLCASSLNLFEGTPRDDDGFFEGSADSIHCERLPAHPVDSTVGVHVHGSVTHQMSDIITTAAMAEYSTVTRELAGGHEKESVKEEGEGRGDSGMEGSDPGDDEEEKGGRSGRRLSSKNLLAERRRRKKLNDRLYALRSLVPKISKVTSPLICSLNQRSYSDQSWASILGDAIEFVKELQNQVKKLQEQLEETSPEDSGMKQAGHVDDNHHPNNVDGISNNNDTLQSPGGRPDKVRQTGNINPEMENSGSPKRTGGSFTTKTANASKQHRSSPATNEEKGNQMEPQVEVCQIGVNKFHLKVFCEHKRGGFVRLLEAMATLGLDVTTVNVTTSKPLVLNIFEVEKRDSEVVQAEQLRSSLLRLAMDSEDGGWPGDPNMAVEKCGAGDHKARRRQPADMRQHQQVDSHQHAHHLHRLHQHQP